MALPLVVPEFVPHFFAVGVLQLPNADWQELAAQWAVDVYKNDKSTHSYIKVSM